MNGPSGWTGWEKRALSTLLHAMIPDLDTICLDEYWDEHRNNAPVELNLALRLSIWFFCVSPVFYLCRVRPLTWLNRSEQQSLLAAACESRFSSVRLLTETLKIIACFAYFRDPSVQRRLRMESGI